jgi:hypothetical protein
LFVSFQNEKKSACGRRTGVTNGLALCTLYHAAFDRDVIGITPDYVVEVRRDVLEQEDGPMLIHGLQGFHGSRYGCHVQRPALKGTSCRDKKCVGGADND